MKTNRKTLLAGLLALGAAALVAGAQEDSGQQNGGGPGGPGGPGGFHRPPPIVTALDTNRDGVIDANEIANASAALLTLDKNGDGVLTTNEYLPPLPANAPAGAPHPPAPAIVKALDANGDGVIDAQEIANAPAALKALDKNGDGQLTRDEYMGQRSSMRTPSGNGHNAEAGQNSPDDAPPGPPPGDN